MGQVDCCGAQTFFCKIKEILQYKVKKICDKIVQFIQLGWERGGEGGGGGGG